MAPKANQMLRSACPFDKMDGVLIIQEHKVCCQEFWSCESTSGYKLAPIDGGGGTLHIEEESSCCLRVCCRYTRPWASTLHEGHDNTAPLAAEYKRPFRSRVHCCKCCCLQEVETRVNGERVGTVKEQCWFCTPSFVVKDGYDAVQYKISYPTCCWGLCVNCCVHGLTGCCKHLHFQIYHPDHPHEHGRQLGSIKKIYSVDFNHEHKFAVRFPVDADHDTKTTIVGSSLLINQVFYERPMKRRHGKNGGEHQYGAV